jgi:hypothetical protein
MARAEHPLLLTALSLSNDVVAAADQGDMEQVAQLDAERLALLQRFRREVPTAGLEDRRVLADIAALNERALGLMQHHLRIAARAFDVATIGRRAVNAYASNRAAR